MVMSGAAARVLAAPPTRRVQGTTGSRGGSDRTVRVDYLVFTMLGPPLHCRVR